ncbi:RagB/SusD family nutrient uptake outer membrane protein [Gaoshiqia sp. Z1-71]|uniref:RagB/SusD family nutrient uptake outer membrane protein n=1 Tax=Gaoshiqia hydrogeniformans TaxID=3290090 RepID=UPI003BF7F91F
MKRYIILSLTAVAMLFVTSCEDVMDTKPYDKFDEATVWGSKATAEAFINSTYNSIVKGMYASFVGIEAWTNNSVHGNGTSFTRELITRDDDFGFNQFQRIRTCNLIIEKVNESTVLNDNEKTALIAEGKFLRSMIYFWLAKRFGKVVWVDRVLGIEDPDFKLPTTPDVATTYAKIIADIDDAIAGLPAEAPTGRASKYAAAALKSEICLQAAAYTGNSAYYQQAIDAADLVINSGKYEMETDYEGMFNEQKPYSKEIILGVYTTKDVTNCDHVGELQNVVPNTNNDRVRASGGSPYFNVDKIFEAWLWWSPSQNLVDNYLVIDQVTGQAIPWDESSQFLASVNKTPGSGSVKEEGEVTDNSRVNELMYQNRDKRFYGTIVYDSCTWFNETVTLCVKGNLYRLVNGGLGPHVGVTNYYWRKGVYNVTPRVFYGIPTDYHWVIFRLGKVYLNKAEALLRQEKVLEAVNALNVTRTVHGDLPESTASTLSDAWADYIRERRVDLAQEGDYYWSLLRWGKYGGDANAGRLPGTKIAALEEAPAYVEISKNRKNYYIAKVTHSQNDVRVFDETRRYLLPIPQGQINRNENLVQNPGW